MVILNASLPPPGRAPQGVDLLLDAFCPGRLSEVVGPLSSGGSSLLLALISRATIAGAQVAFVDAADALDPVSAATAGADLSHLLWVQCGRRLDAAWSATDLLARCPGFGLVVLDLGEWPGAGSDARASVRCRRLQRAVEHGAAALVLRAPRSIAGGAAALVVSMRRIEARWIGMPRPSRFEGLVSEAEVLRARLPRPGAPREGERVQVQWQS